MPAEPTSRPDFIHHGGSPLMHPPLQLKQSEMYGFFVRGDLARMQRTVDATLNAAAGREMRFKVLTPFVMLTFTRVQRASSSWPSDHAKGWGAETDIITWVMVGQEQVGPARAGQEQPDQHAATEPPLSAQQPGEAGISHVFFYPCHIWVDDGMALINGRELYGYPKNLCDYRMPQPGEPARHFALAAKGFQTFTPESPLAMHPLLEVNAIGDPGTPQALTGLMDLIEQAMALLGANLPAFLSLDSAGWAQIAGMLRSPGADQIFLKQFPDASGLKAVYQAVVSAQARVTAVHGVELLGHAFECRLHRCASFPLNETLGLPLGTQPALLPFHLSFDFEVLPGVELHDNSKVAPEKIAILGGGVAAMTSAFYLSDQPGWQNRYDITVYQMGWRLGGKGASGRNAGLGQRIEEHGLHIWFGFYENAFGAIQRVYELLDRPAGSPLATWQDAFKPQHAMTLTERIGDEWRLWPIDTPLMPGNPGDHNEDISLWKIALTMYQWISQWLRDLQACGLAAAEGGDRSNMPTEAMITTTTVSVSDGQFGWLHAMALHLEREVTHFSASLHSMFDAVLAFAQSLPEALAAQRDEQQALQARALKSVRATVQQQFARSATTLNDVPDELRRLYIGVDLGLTVLIGLFEDGVFTQGFDVINDEDLRAWLTRHGADTAVTVDSAPIRGFYDLVFAYEDGDFAKPNAEAGTMLRGMLRVAFDYQGGLMWKMQAGMGDAVFAPYYELLKRRGVKFKFFHKVEELVPAAHTDSVEQIRFTQQVALAPGLSAYDPLITVKGLACWPSTPKGEQLDPTQAALLQQARINLESNWSDWPERYQLAFGEPLPTLTLQRGVDFDKVIFAISAASVPQLCPQIVARSPALQASCAHVKTVATQAYQVWFDKTLPQLGWNLFGRQGQEPVVTSFSEPYDTWAPMSHLLCREDWPDDTAPRHVSYFCSALPITDYPPFSDHGFPARMALQAKEGAMGQLTRQISALWPAVATPHSFDWSTLFDPSHAQGARRFDSQYWRANVDPSERYVMSLVGSSKHRVSTHGTGFSNLYVTGDWIRTGINAGCVEAATMAGMQTAQAISGHPRLIAGNKDL